jgi:uncharacterized protein
MIRPAPASAWRAAARGALALLLWLVLGGTGWADPAFPALTGRVVDEAGILSPTTRAQIDALSAEREQKTGEQIVVATVKSLQGYTIEEFGVGLGRHWGIGQKGRDNGAILLVAPNERKVRIEVGYGLEDRLTDAQSRIIIEEVILPEFRRGDFDAGVRDGAAAMLRTIGGEAPEAAPSAQSSGDEDVSVFGYPLADVAKVIFIAVFGAVGLLFLAPVLVGILGLLALFVAIFLALWRWRHAQITPGHEPRWIRFLDKWVAAQAARLERWTRYWGSSSSGSGFTSSSGGFSGGGGSFGGGGASGSW